MEIPNIHRNSKSCTSRTPGAPSAAGGHKAHKAHQAHYATKRARRTRRRTRRRTMGTVPICKEFDMVFPKVLCLIFFVQSRVHKFVLSCWNNSNFRENLWYRPKYCIRKKLSRFSLKLELFQRLNTSIMFFIYHVCHAFCF